MATVTKIDKDIAAAKAKLSELQKKIRELETKRVEAENLQIVKLVKTVNIDNKTLTALLKAYATASLNCPKNTRQSLKTRRTRTMKMNRIKFAAAVFTAVFALSGMTAFAQSNAPAETPGRNRN